MRQKFKFQALEITIYRVYKSWDLFWGKRETLQITTTQSVGSSFFKGVNLHTCWNFADQKMKQFGKATGKGARQ